MAISLRNKYHINVILKLISVSALISILASFMAITLRKITEYYETIFSLRAAGFISFYFLFPLIGLTIIYFLRKYLFRNKGNKGIAEIFDCTRNVSSHLPAYKIPSHFINGFFTVISGGSTGIEVSTVVASATIGSLAQQKDNLFKKYKTELICAGIAAGITALFGSPLGGLLFCLEVISGKINKTLLLTNIIAVFVASMLLYFLNEPSLFFIKLTTWHIYAIPYFILLGVLAGINSVFLTKSVLFFKSQFLKIKHSQNRIISSSFIIGFSILLLPVLYGDGYHGIKEILLHPNDSFTIKFFITILGVIILKPIVTSVTLASGGDGGVFAPSLVIGAFLGFFTATFLNTFFHANVIPVNFIIIGMAALLSASIHAPFTAIFLVSSLVNNYTLFIPLLIVCLISKYTAKYVYPYTVYSYKLKPTLG